MRSAQGWKGTWVAKIDTSKGTTVDSATFRLERTGSSVRDVSVSLTSVSMKSGDVYVVPFVFAKGLVVEFDVEVGPNSGHTAIAAINLDPQTGQADAIFPRPFPTS